MFATFDHHEVDVDMDSTLICFPSLIIFYPSIYHDAYHIMHPSLPWGRDSLLLHISSNFNLIWKITPSSHLIFHAPQLACTSPLIIPWRLLKKINLFRLRMQVPVHIIVTTARDYCESNKCNANESSEMQ